MKPSRRIIFILSFSLVSSILILLLTLKFEREEKREEISLLIKSLDIILEEKNFPEMEKLLSRGINQKNLSANSWLQILKRIYLYSSETGYFLPFETLSAKAHKELPGNRDILILYLHSLLRRGKYREASAYIDKLPDTENLRSLKMEILLGTLSDPESQALAKNINDPLSGTLFSRDPEVFLQAARYSQDDRFYINAAMLFMERGEYPRALQVLKEKPLGISPEALFYIAYDAGDLELSELLYSKGFAEEKITQTPLLLSLGDIFLLRGDLEDAENLYVKLIEQNPRISWIPYHNSALITYKRGNLSEALKKALEAHLIFPDQKELNLLLIKFLEEKGQQSQVKELVHNYNSIFPEDTFFNYLNTFLERAGNLERYEADVWNLLSNSGADERIYRLFAGHLLGKRAFEGLFMILDRAEERFPEGSWIFLLRGIGYALSGNAEAGLLEMNRTLSLGESWEVWYNQGMINSYLKNLEQAETAFRNSLSLAGTENPKIQSIIFTKLAQVLTQTGNKEAANRHIRYALELFPYNLEAQNLKRILER